jgi:3-oxoacyl-[acyl-carrier protein] reductase
MQNPQNDSQSEERIEPPQASYPDLAGKVAVVTGGSRGIGAATARSLAANGASVVIVGRDEQALTAVARSIRGHGHRALAVTADCTVEADVERLARTVTEQLGTPDILAPFAGGNGMPVPTPEETVVHWAEVISSDLTSTFMTTRAFLPAMIEQNDRMRAWTTEEQRRQLASSFPLRRIGQPEDVAAAALFLASDVSSWITGITLDIAGGKIMV